LGQQQGNRNAATGRPSACDRSRLRCDELHVAGITLDDVAGLPTGYVNKLLSSDPARVLSRISFGPLLGALGLVLVVTEDAEALARVRARLTKRSPRTATLANNRGPRRRAQRADRATAAAST
jgi:hypothetical protein